MASPPMVIGMGRWRNVRTSRQPPIDRDLLRSEIRCHLESIGLNGSRPHGSLSKDAIRDMHRFHREAARQRIHRALGNKIDLFLEEIANGDEVDPEKIRPELVEARSDARSGEPLSGSPLSYGRYPCPRDMGEGCATLSKTGPTEN